MTLRSQTNNNQNIRESQQDTQNRVQDPLDWSLWPNRNNSLDGAPARDSEAVMPAAENSDMLGAVGGQANKDSEPRSSGQQPIIDFNAAIATLTSQVQNQIKLGLDTIAKNLDFRFESLRLQTEPDWPRQMPPLPNLNNVGLGNYREQLPRQSGFTNTNTNANSSFHYNSSPFDPKKAATIIKSWNVQFNGLLSGPTVEKFIYQINTLTRDCLNGNFDLLCDHSYLLFVDDASNWYWRFRSGIRNDRVKWDELCIALKEEFKEARTETELTDLVRDRMQRENEPFDTFYRDVLRRADRLRYGLSNRELLGILQRNLRPEIRQQLFMVKVESVSHLRSLCQRYENLFQNSQKPRFGAKAFPKHINEIACSSQASDTVMKEEELCALGESKLICWNCRKGNHRYIDCLEPRTNFCFGCGAPNMYKPNCPKCNPSENLK